jgi:hypothetical protein
MAAPAMAKATDAMVSTGIKMRWKPVIAAF